MLIPYLIIIAYIHIHDYPYTLCGGYKRMLDCLTRFEHRSLYNCIKQFRNSESQKKHQVLNSAVASRGPVFSSSAVIRCHQEGLLEPPADSSGGFRFDSTCNDVKRRRVVAMRKWLQDYSKGTDCHT